MWTLYHNILHENKIFQNKFVLGPGVVKIKKIVIFSKKRENRDFRNKNAHKIGEIIFCQQQKLFLDRINWFMHKNKV